MGEMRTNNVLYTEYKNKSQICSRIYIVLNNLDLFSSKIVLYLLKIELRFSSAHTNP